MSQFQYRPRPRALFRTFIVVCAFVNLSCTDAKPEGDDQESSEPSTEANTEHESEESDGDSADSDTSGTEAQDSSGSSTSDSDASASDSNGDDSTNTESGSGTLEESGDESSSEDDETSGECLDQQIFDSEVVPTRADIQDLVDAYEPDKRLEWAIDVLARRYPTGSFILETANNKTDCFEISFSDTAKAQSIIEGLRTAVHECGHMIDLNSPERFVVWEDLIYSCDFALPRSGPPRSIILDDGFQERWPDDSFKKTYLEELGDQTFEALLNEASQYINTLATSYAFYDFTTFDPVARDGVHAFYWYIGRFLRKARIDHAEFYDKLAGDACWRQLVLTLWGRSERYLDLSAGLDGLGGQDDALLHELRNDPEILAEIDRLRALDGCP